MSKELCPCGMNIKCGYVVTRKDGTKFCSQDMNCEASNKWLVEHDADLLDKVADKIHKKMCSENCGERQCVDAMDRCVWYGYIDEVIAEMKAEVENDRRRT